MKMRLLALIAALCLLTGLLAACSSEPEVITIEEAQQIVLDDLGVSADEVSDIHTHIGTVDGIACYNISVTVGSVSKTYSINSTTGEIISVTDGGHSH